MKQIWLLSHSIATCKWTFCQIKQSRRDDTLFMRFYNVLNFIFFVYVEICHIKKLNYECIIFLFTLACFHSHCKTQSSLHKLKPLIVNL